MARIVGHPDVSDMYDAPVKKSSSFLNLDASILGASSDSATGSKNSLSIFDLYHRIVG